MLDDIKELFQSLIAPQLEGIKCDIRALDSKIDALDSKIDAKYETVDAKFLAVIAKIDAIDTKVESFRRELLAEIRRVETTLTN